MCLAGSRGVGGSLLERYEPGKDVVMNKVRRLTEWGIQREAVLDLFIGVLDSAHTLVLKRG